MEVDELEKELRAYEVGYVALEETAVTDVSAVLQQHQAEVVVASPVKPVTLAYPINKHRSAFFGYIQFRSVPDQAVAIEKALGAHKKILRSLLVTVPKRRPQPKAPVSAPSTDAAATTPLAPKAESERARPNREVLSNEALEQKLEEILQ